MNIHFDSGSLDTVCMGIFFLFFFVLLVIALVFNRKRKQQLLALSQQFGFQPISHPSAELLDGLNHAYSPSTISRVKNISLRRFGDEDLYLLDIYSRSGLSWSKNNEENPELSCLAFYSPYLDLPQFILFSRLQTPAQISNLIDSMLEKVLAQSVLHTFQDVPPDFDTKYALYVLDDTAAAQCFTPEVLSRIAALDSLYSRGQGKTLVVTNSRIHQGGKLDTSNFNEYINSARSLCDLLVK
jgi:hypothetical protein